LIDLMSSDYSINETKITGWEGRECVCACSSRASATQMNRGLSWQMSP